MAGSLLTTFNRGIVSKDALGRIALDRVRLSAETQTNWMPRALGGMSIRPGLEYITGIPADAKVRPIPFIFSAADMALLLVTAAGFTVLVDDEPVSRPLVATAVTNGTFGSDLTGWADADEAGATSAWATGGYMSLVGSRFNSAIRTQTLTVAAQDQNTRHALRIVINRGPVTLRVGSTSGGDEYITEATLGTGTHSLAFTPTGASVYVRLSNRNKRIALVESIAVEGEGVMTLPVPWSVGYLPLLRHDQSNDVIFVACEGYQQRRIERRAADSWSIILYEPEDGPYRLENTSKIKIGASAISGNVTLTASQPLFRSGHVGALFRIRSIGQLVSINITAEDQWSDAIRVTGVSNARNHRIVLSGTWSATVQLQRSVGEEGSWVDQNTYNSNGDYENDDGLDNQIVFYRIGVKVGDFTSGTVVAELSIDSGAIYGVAKITAVASPTGASAAVIKELGGTEASEIWSEGSWSDYRGWPSAVAFYEGRLGWFGKSGVWQSVSDTVDIFDPTTVGDSGPINRTIRYGSADIVCWAQAAQRLLVGTASAELSIRSTSFDEPLTPTNYNVKPASTQGSRRLVPAVLIDGNVVFVQAGGTRVYELQLGGQGGGLDYTPVDLTTLVPEIGEPEIIAMAVQRQPDTRIHCVRSDGKVALAVIDKLENVLAWVLIETDGVIENVVRLPGDIEDQVYYVVKRTINSVTKRYLEKWAMQSNCIGGSVNQLLDSHKVISGSPSANIGGLTHLEGETVRCWGDGIYQGEFTVSGGQITLPVEVSDAVVGLPYEASYKSAKFATIFKDGSSSLGWPTSIKSVHLLARYLHKSAVKYGDSFDVLYPMPEIEGGKPVPANYIWTDYDSRELPIDGSWSSDSRLCLMAYAPYPATILGLAPVLDANPG